VREVEFGLEDLEHFRRFSHDANPLHIDPEYARRTPFGQPVVYGMLGALATLGELARTPFRLRSLACAFPAPLFPGVRYHVTSTPRDDRTVLRLMRGTALKAEVTAQIESRTDTHCDGPAPDWLPSTAAEKPDPSTLAGTERRGTYVADFTALHDSGQWLGLSQRTLPSAQLAALAWVSWYCGMIVPGRQSLVSKVRFEFEEVDAPTSGLEWTARVGKWDPRFGALSISATLASAGARVAEVTIDAFSRPQPVELSLDAIADAVGRSARLRGCVALVTGGSRGLGAHLSSALALHGATVLVNFRSGREEAEALAGALRSQGGSVELVQGDIADEVDCARIADTIGRRHGGLDLLVSNASPPILPAEPGELTEDEVAEFIDRSLAVGAWPARQLLPLLRAGRGTVAFISSSYVDQPPRRFAHYVAAKAAAERYLSSIVAEAPELTLLLLRPPRLHTDQTNVTFDLEPHLPPSRVAARLIEALGAPRGGGVHVLSDFTGSR